MKNNKKFCKLSKCKYKLSRLLRTLTRSRGRYAKRLLDCNDRYCSNKAVECISPQHAMPQLQTQNEKPTLLKIRTINSAFLTVYNKTFNLQNH